MMVAPGAYAQEFSLQRGGVLDAKTLNVQAKAEELFARGDYDRAHFIYRNELAPIGDKYAQYMLGFMALSGLGVREDPILASAWYRLAAERDIEEFDAARDALMQHFDDVDRAQSDRIYLRLRRQYSDIVLRMREVREDYDYLNGNSTGSRFSNPGGAVTIVNPRAGTSMSGDAYYRQVLRRMQRHLDQIAATLEIETMNANLSHDEMAELEEKVEEYVETVDDL